MAKFLLLEHKPYEGYQKFIKVDIIDSLEIFRRDDKKQIHFKFKDGTTYIKKFDSVKELDRFLLDIS